MALSIILSGCSTDQIAEAEPKTEGDIVGIQSLKEYMRLMLLTFQNPSDPDATFRHKAGKAREQKKNYAVHISANMAERARGKSAQNLAMA